LFLKLFKKFAIPFFSLTLPLFSLFRQGFNSFGRNFCFLVFFISLFHQVFGYSDDEMFDRGNSSLTLLSATSRYI